MKKIEVYVGGRVSVGGTLTPFFVSQRSEGTRVYDQRTEQCFGLKQNRYVLSRESSWPAFEEDLACFLRNKGFGG